MKHYLPSCEAKPDYVERRSQFRAEHPGLGWAAHERGEPAGAPVRPEQA